MRSSSFSVLFLLVILCLAFGAAAFAQKPTSSQQVAAQPPRTDDQTKIGVLEIRLPIAVKEKKLFVSGLTQSNFEVYEDGKRQNITNFIAPSQLPLNIALLMDTSNS